METPTVEQMIKARDLTLRWYRGTYLYHPTKAAWDAMIAVLRNGGTFEDCLKAIDPPPVENPFTGTCLIGFR